ncbi:MAG: hypothetical protein ACXW2E_01425 [Nitrososphaeraceae archaeon]
MSRLLRRLYIKYPEMRNVPLTGLRLQLVQEALRSKNSKYQKVTVLPLKLLSRNKTLILAVELLIISLTN